MTLKVGVVTPAGHRVERATRPWRASVHDFRCVRQLADLCDPDRDGIARGQSGGLRDDDARAGEHNRPGGTRTNVPVDCSPAMMPAACSSGNAVSIQ